VDKLCLRKGLLAALEKVKFDLWFLRMKGSRID
jgi:hypothetical protein